MRSVLLQSIDRRLSLRGLSALLDRLAGYADRKGERLFRYAMWATIIIALGAILLSVGYDAYIGR